MQTTFIILVNDRKARKKSNMCKTVEAISEGFVSSVCGAQCTSADSPIISSVGAIESTESLSDEIVTRKSITTYVSTGTGANAAVPFGGAVRLRATRHSPAPHSALEAVVRAACRKRTAHVRVCSLQHAYCISHESIRKLSTLMAHLRATTSTKSPTRKCIADSGVPGCMAAFGVTFMRAM